MTTEPAIHVGDLTKVFRVPVREGGLRAAIGSLVRRSTFGFPIEALVGILSTERLLGGLAVQAFWIVVGAIFLRLVWRTAVRRYSAVGG